MIILAHPNDELIGLELPILVLEEKVEESMNQTGNKEDIFVSYTYDGIEHMAYIHNWNNDVILLILDRINE
jgi:hypothetical protein